MLSYNLKKIYKFLILYFKNTKVCYNQNIKKWDVDQMAVKINLGAWDSVFAVPSQVVDEGLKFSDGVKLKVLLFVLRNAGSNFTDKDISEATGVNITDIPEALDYWVSMGILQKSSGEYSPAQSTDNSFEEIKSKNNIKEKNAEISDSANKNDNKDKNSKPKFTVSRPQKPDYVFTSQRLAVDEELQMLVNEAQVALGKTLSNSDISTLLMLKDTCGVPLDVILMLIQYCISIDKGNMRTVEKIGIQWADEGINSVEDADNKIRQIKQTSKYFSVISSAFGLKNAGSPTKKQLEYGNKWVGEWKFSPELLREAYERCVDTKGETNFRYIDGILKRWNANNIRSEEDLQKFENSAAKNKFKQKSSYNIDELEKIDTLDNF